MEASLEEIHSSQYNLSFPTGGLKIIKSMMMMSLNIAIYINLILGLQYTSMISQNKWAHLIIGFINFFTGNFLDSLMWMEIAMDLGVPTCNL